MKTLNVIIKTILILFLLTAIGFFCYAMWGANNKGELDVGDFGVNELSEGWTLQAYAGDMQTNVTLPFVAREDFGEDITLTNKLPDTIRNGMRLCFASKRQDVKVYINGELREQYSADKYEFDFKEPISSLITCDLYDSDASGEICLEIVSKDGGEVRYDTVTYAYGNNVWFPYITRNIPLVMIAAFSIVLCIITIIGYFFVRGKVAAAKSVVYLSLTIIIIGLWILSESGIKQLLFTKSSLSNLFSFLFIEIVAAFGAMYFNEVQRRRYEKVYVGLELLIMLLVCMNTILHFTGAVDYYDTMWMSHAASGIVIVWAFVSLIMDIRSKQIRKYSITAFGMLLLIICSMLELVNFYTSAPLGAGVFLSIGLLILLAATIIQTVVDTIRRANEQRRSTELMTEKTFSTIASTIDAKDKYTGGHSERVGEYAGKICAKVMKKYKLKNEDVERISYIGRMHDIGKIGVPDRVLNKKGKLENDEYALMKNHTVIGSEMLANMDSIEGLNDGVRHHHERYDGKGYPDGLKGEEISLFARILCLADCYDAMTTDRVYRKRLSKDRVIDEIEKNKGSQFDPGLADTVLEMIRLDEL